MKQCLKCGKAVIGRNVFCAECLEVMDRYPVKPGTIAHIPDRPVAPVTKGQGGNPTAALKEQIAHQRVLIRWLAGIAAFSTVLMLIVGAILLQTIKSNEPARPTIGRNYTTSTSP